MEKINKHMKLSDTSNYILRTSKEYSVYVCEQRAIPKIEDGLKNGQRMALWLLRNKADKIKTSALTGLLAAEKIYVHGEASANNAIGLLAAPYKNNVPLIQGLGQFGSRVYPVDGIGAPRYTEVRRARAAEALLYKDLDLVPLEDNYDGSTKQPKHFLPLIPLVLLNGVEGVAVGWSTSILPRSLDDLLQATKDALQGKKIKQLIPSYLLYDIKIKPLAASNQWEYSGAAIVEDTSTVRITELPPGMSVETFRKRLNEYEDQEKIVSFSENSTDNINITVRFKRGAVKGWSEQTAIDFFKIKEKVTERITVVDWGGTSIRVYKDAEEVVSSFVAWRLNWYETRYKKLLADDQYELVYWKLLAALFKQGFTKKLGTFADRAEIDAAVNDVATKAKLKIVSGQSDRAVNLPTYRWTKAFEAEVQAKIAEMEATILDYQDILKKPQRRKDIYLNELSAIR